MAVNRDRVWNPDFMTFPLLPHSPGKPPNPFYQIQNQDGKSASVDSTVEASSASARDTGFLHQRKEPSITIIFKEMPTWGGGLNTCGIRSILSKPIVCKTLSNRSIQYFEGLVSEPFNLGFKLETKSFCNYMSTYGLNLGGLGDGVSEDDIKRLRAPGKRQVGIQAQNWTDDLERDVERFRKEAHTKGLKGADMCANISNRLWELGGFDRSPKQCQHILDILNRRKPKQDPSGSRSSKRSRSELTRLRRVSATYGPASTDAGPSSSAVELFSSSTVIRDVNNDSLATTAIPCSEYMENGVSTANGASTVNISIPFQQHREVQGDVQISKPASQVMRSRVRNDGNSARKGAYVQNWIDERTRVFLLSKIESCEGGCGDQSANQGQPERALSEMKPANDTAGMGDIRHHSFRINDDASYSRSSDLETEQTSTESGDDLSSVDITMPSVSFEQRASSSESLPANKPQVEATGDNFAARAKRPRSRNWSADEKCAFLELKVKAMSAVEGKDLNYIPLSLKERYGFERTSKDCAALWDTLLKAYRAIRGHEASACDSQTSKRVSFWEMDKDERSRKKLPLVFPMECYKTMERILAAQKEKRSNRKSRGIPAQEPLSDEDGGQYPYIRAADPFGEGSKQQTEREPPRMTDWAETFVKRQVEDEVNSSLQSLPYSTELCELLTSIAPIVKKQVEAAVIIELELLALTRVDIIDDEDSSTRLIPLVKQCLKAAVTSALGPVASALQAWAHEEQVNQERLRVIQEKRRALDLEEMQLRKRQRLGQHQRTWRTMFYKQQGLRGKIPPQGVSSRH